MPFRHKVHRDAILENHSVAYKPEGLISGEFPVVPVVRESDIYYVYSKDLMNIPETARTKGKANEPDWDMSTASYLLTNHALQKHVYDRDKRNTDKPINLEFDATEILTQKLMLRFEKSCATLFQGDANWSNSMSLSADASFVTNTTNPIRVYDSATSVIAVQSGKLPNTAIVNYDTWLAIKENSATVDRIKFTSADSLGPDMFARLINVQKFLVARTPENTAQEPFADATTTSQQSIWTNASWIGYLESSAGLQKASAVYVFQLNMGTNGVKVDRWRDDEEEADVIRVQKEYQVRAVATSCGFLIEDTI